MNENRGFTFPDKRPWKRMKCRWEKVIKQKRKVGCKTGRQPGGECSVKSLSSNEREKEMYPTQGKCGGQRKHEGSGWVPRKRIMKEKWTRREVLGEKGANCLGCRGKKSFPGLWPTSISLPRMEKWKGKRGMGGRKGEWIRGGGVCGARQLERQVTGGFGPRLCNNGRETTKLTQLQRSQLWIRFFLINRLVIVKDLFWRK